MKQKHIHFSRIKFFDKIKYISLGTAIGVGIAYYSDVNPIDKARSLYLTHKGSLTEYSHVITDYLKK